MLQDVSDKPLLVRQIPIWENNTVTGFVDLALERAFVYRPHTESQVVDMPEKLRIARRKHVSRCSRNSPITMSI